MDHVHSLIDEYSFFDAGKKMINTISDKQYVFCNSPFFSSSADKHMRHVIDHYASFLDGYSTQIDYDARIRDERSEDDRGYAVSQITKYIAKLKDMASNSFFINQSILVKSNEAETGSDSLWSISSIKRELQFLIGHTVHHYAFVAFILRTQHVALPDHFGVAPSTLKYEMQMAQES